MSLLYRGPQCGYQLRAGFDGVTGGVWSLNIGQVYSTLSRLARDGLIQPSEGGTNGQQPFALTAAGRQEVQKWFLSPQSVSERPRDELSVKIALAVSTPGIEAHAVIQHQRVTTMRCLQEYTRLLAHDSTDADLAWRLLLERLITDLDAQLRWLDRCDELIAAKADPPAPVAEPDRQPRAEVVR